MSALAEMHPVQLVLGEMMIAEELATRGRQMTFAVIARDCIGWAYTVRDVLCEIAQDAGDVNLMVHEAAADGIFSPTEQRQIVRKVDEIATQAREGRIIA